MPSQCCLSGPSLQPDLWGTQPSEHPLLQLCKSSSALDLCCSWSPSPTTSAILSLSLGPVLLDISSLIPKHGDEWSHQPVARPLPLDNPGAIWVTLKENSYQWWGEAKQLYWSVPRASLVQRLLVTRRLGMTEHLLISLNSPGPSSLSLPKWSLLARQDWFPKECSLVLDHSHSQEKS